jgi:hypothetical protein
MIKEMVICDNSDCDWKQELFHGMVPDTWARYDGLHFCSLACLDMEMATRGKK